MREDTLHDELAVVFGAKISAASAAKRLREFASHIEKNGVLVGIDKHDNYVVESVDGSLYAAGRTIIPRVIRFTGSLNWRADIFLCEAKIC